MRVGYILISIFWLIILAPVVAQAQQLQFEQLTTADGLPSDDVYSLHTDGKGYIWAATNYGPVRYNGHSLIPVLQNISFKENLPYCMFQNSKGEFWFTNSRANVYQVKNDSAFLIKGFESFSKGLHKQGWDVNNMIIDDANRIYLSTFGNSYRIDPSQNFKISDLNEGLKKDELDFMVIVRNGRSLAVRNSAEQRKDSEIYSYRIIGANDSTIKKVIVKDESRIRIAKFENGTLYIAAGNEFVQVGPSGRTCTNILPNPILCHKTDKEKNSWLGVYEAGLYKIDSNGTILEHYFSGTTVNDVLFDGQSGLWVSTAGRGMFHCKSINSYATVFGNEAITSVSMCRKIDSLLFIGTYRGELYMINNREKPKKIDLDNTMHKMISDIVTTPTGYYIGSKDALLRTDKSFKILERIVTPDHVPVTSMDLEYNSKGELYSLGRTSLQKIENGRSILAVDLPAKGFCMIRYGGDSLLLSTKGLQLFDGKELTCPPFLERLYDVLVTKLIRSPQNEIWIATLGEGLFCLQPDNTLVSYTKMPGRVIHDILFLNDTTMVLCFNTGTFITSRNQLNNIRNWDQLIKEESSDLAELNERIYAATNGFLFSFSNKRTENAARLYFRQAETDDSLYSAQAPLEFNHKQEKIRFDFDLLDYTSSYSKLFYFLDGPYTEKGTTDGRSIILKKLPPGNYSLTVYPGSSIYASTEKSVVVEFVVLPAFWQTTWFMLTVITLSVLVLITIIHMINNRTRIKERQKAEITRLLAEYKLTALKAQINPHFISNALSAIQQLILDNKNEKAGQYLAKFSLLIRHVLKYSDKSIVSLSEELEMIDLNIELETLRFKDNFEIRKSIAKGIDPSEINVPPLITQPFIENAIWHGLLPLKGIRKPELSIKVSRKEDNVEIVIEDNGVGRVKKEDPERESRGTKLIVNRLENINLSLGVDTAKLEVEDLFDASGTPSGTRVTIVIPGKLTTTEYDED